MAPVFSIQLLTLIVKVGNPASFLKWSNSTTLKIGLYKVSQVPRNSMVLRFLIQFFMMSAARASPPLAFTISVIQIKSSSLIVVRAISIPYGQA